MAAGKRTKIVCTVGPATEDDAVLRAMIEGGMNVARLNFSHGDHAYHRRAIERVRRISGELGVPVAILVDTKGPEIRTRENEGHAKVALASGDTVRVTTADVKSRAGLIALDYEALPREVSAGDTIYLDDGLIALTVDAVGGDEVACTISNGGFLGEHKGVNIPHVITSLPSLTDRDRDDIRFSCEMGVDAVAASFVRDAAGVREIRDFCRECGAPDMLVFSKIESALAVEHFDEILAASDGIMVARGDLGVEIPPADVPYVQKQIIHRCNEEYRPVITATQMLESMTYSPRPTRAEVTDVANAIYDGTDCVMLSGETAAGAWPVEAVRTMAEVCRKTEEHLAEQHSYHDRGGMRNVSGATGYAAVAAARLLDAKALICPTMSGLSARIMSVFKPHLPIIATTPMETTLRRTCFYWGVEAILTDEQESLTRVCYDALRKARAHGLLEPDDIVVITAGDPLTSPLIEDEQVTAETSTNVFMIAQAF